MTGAQFYTLFPVNTLPHHAAFIVDDSWNHHLEKHGDSVSLWTHLFVECMLACGTYLDGRTSLLLCNTALHLLSLFLPELKVKGLQGLRHEQLNQHSHIHVSVTRGGLGVKPGT